MDINSLAITFLDSFTTDVISPSNFALLISLIQFVDIAYEAIIAQYPLSWKNFLVCYNGYFSNDLLQKWLITNAKHIPLNT